jgi:hypothetical protein
MNETDLQLRQLHLERERCEKAGAAATEDKDAFDHRPLSTLIRPPH